jgi:erythrocyte band 7 integral membrane protein
MAKSANSKVIFLPGLTQADPSALAQADSVGEGPRSHGAHAGNSIGVSSSAGQEYGGNDRSFQSAINSHVIENM